MKYFLFIVVFFLCIHNLYGQRIIDKMRFECQYSFFYQKDTLMQKVEEDLLILQIGGELSKCYSYYSNQVDSIFALPNYHEVAKRILDQAFSRKEIGTNDYPHKRMKDYVYKNYPKGKMTVTDGLSLQDYIYTDELNTQNWQVQDSTKSVLNYVCQKAECNFRGRRWTVWFAPDIPVADGPWKFSGLPGLIMEAYDLGRQYHFIIVGLKQEEGGPIFFSETYTGSKRFEKTNRKNFLKAKKRYLMDINNYIELETGIDLGNNSPQKVMRYDLIERDYK